MIKNYNYNDKIKDDNYEIDGINIINWGSKMKNKVDISKK